MTNEELERRAYIEGRTEDARLLGELLDAQRYIYKDREAQANLDTEFRQMERRVMELEEENAMLRVRLNDASYYYGLQGMRS